MAYCCANLRTPTRSLSGADWVHATRARHLWRAGSNSASRATLVSLTLLSIGSSSEHSGIYSTLGRTCRSQSGTSVASWRSHGLITSPHQARALVHGGNTRVRTYYTKHQDGAAKLVSYSNANMAGNIDNCKSTSGIIFFLDGNPVTW
jgi:hypothetical protein